MSRIQFLLFFLPHCYSFHVLVIGTNVVVVSTDRYCTNCGVPSATSICTSCLQRRKCHACHRRLEDYFFASSHTCHACTRRKAKPKVRQAVGETVTEVDIPAVVDDISFGVFFERQSNEIRRIVNDYRRRLGSVRVHVRADTSFTREVEGIVQRVPGYFGTRPQDVNDADGLDVNVILNELNIEVENFTARGSGFVFERVKNFTLCITKFRPLVGSTFIPTPPEIAKKHCVMNVQNDDNKCFLWAILSAVYRSKNNPNRICSYIKHENSLNFGDLEFPIGIKDISKFEHLNPSISVNVLYRDSETGDFSIEYLSLELNRQHHVNLLLLDSDDDDKRHYVWISDMSRLVAGRTKHVGKTHVCNSCLQPFSSKRVLDNHIPNCLRHHPQQVVYPDPGNPKEYQMKFSSQRKQHYLPFFLVSDFESFLAPVVDGDDDEFDRGTCLIDEHQVSGFCCYRVSEIPQYQTDPVVYSGPGTMEKFYEHVMAESETLSDIVRNGIPMIPLSSDQQSEYDSATTCFSCNCNFTPKNHKTRHHCHISGKFLFAACNNCNLQLKMTGKKNKRRHPRAALRPQHDDVDFDEQAAVDYEQQYFLPIIFHNLKNYGNRKPARRHRQNSWASGPRCTVYSVRASLRRKPRGCKNITSEQNCGTSHISESLIIPFRIQPANLEFFVRLIM